MTTAVRYMTSITKWTTFAGVSAALAAGGLIGIGWMVFQVLVYIVQG